MDSGIREPFSWRRCGTSIVVSSRPTITVDDVDDVDWSFGGWVDYGAQGTSECSSGFDPPEK